MKKIIYGSITALCIPFLSNAQAAETVYSQCMEGSEGVTLYMLNCLSAELDFQDKRLNTTYQWAMNSLANKQDKEALKNRQRSWIKYRDSECAPDKESGTAASIDSYSCLVTATSKRATVLFKMTESE